jgi:nucleotide-binding universal stress UspA family protein
MNDFKKIMVALGFSEYAPGILKYATRLASNLDADLLVVNIINERDVEAIGSIAEMGYDLDSEQYVKSIKSDRQAQLEQMIAESGFPGQRVQTVIKVGKPTDALLKMVVKEKVDMVVMGVKNRTELESLFFGSVAEKMFRRSPVTIVSYRDEKIAKRLRRHIDV